MMTSQFVDHVDATLGETALCKPTVRTHALRLSGSHSLSRQIFSSAHNAIDAKS
jgi:hypothetical protein